MILPDVNVLIYALRKDLPEHALYRAWLEGVVNTPTPFGLSDEVLSSVIRLTTHPKIFLKPSSLDQALSEVARLRARPNAVAIAPGPRHWEIFASLLRARKATGNIVPDARLAALAIEHGCTLVTSDRGFAQFPDLQHRPAVVPG